MAGDTILLFQESQGMFLREILRKQQFQCSLTLKLMFLQMMLKNVTEKGKPDRNKKTKNNSAFSEEETL